MKNLYLKRPWKDRHNCSLEAGLHSSVDSTWVPRYDALWDELDHFMTECVSYNDMLLLFMCTLPLLQPLCRAVTELQLTLILGCYFSFGVLHHWFNSWPSARCWLREFQQAPQWAWTRRVSKRHLQKYMEGFPNPSNITSTLLSSMYYPALGAENSHLRRDFLQLFLQKNKWFPGMGVLSQRTPAEYHLEFLVWVGASV